MQWSIDPIAKNVDDINQDLLALVKRGSTTSISANGTQSVPCTGLTSAYEIMRFGCSTGENNPGADVTITTNDGGTYTITVADYRGTAFTISPVFIKYLE